MSGLSRTSHQQEKTQTPGMRGEPVRSGMSPLVEDAKKQWRNDYEITDESTIETRMNLRPTSERDYRTKVNHAISFERGKVVRSRPHNQKTREQRLKVPRRAGVYS